MSSTVADEMSALARRLRSEHPALDGSLASLDTLDTLAGSTASPSEHAVPSGRSLGAYLGQVILGAAPQTLRWAGETEAPALACGRALWFPCEKVARRQQNGPHDDLPAFAALVLSSNPGAAERIEQAMQRPRVVAARKAVVSAVERLRAAPASWQPVVDLDRCLGRLPLLHHRDLLERLQLRADELIPALPFEAAATGHSTRMPRRC
jgi:hypothetical protein